MSVASGTVGRVAVEFLLDHTNFDAGLKAVNAAMQSKLGGGVEAMADRINKALDSVGNSATAKLGSRIQQAARSIGTGLTAAITLPVVGGGVALAKLGADFDTLVTKIGTLTGAGSQDVEFFRAAVLRLAPALGQSPTDLAQGLLTITSIGPRGAEALDILENSAKAATIGFGSTETVARTVTAALQAYSATGLTAAQATDQLAVGIQAGGAEAEDFAGSLNRVIPIAAQLGVPLSDVISFVATFTKLGGTADEAVTGLRGALLAMVSPSDQASQALRGIGLSSEALRQEVKDKGLTETLIGLVDAFKGDPQGLSGIVEDVRALTGILNTAGVQAKSYRQVTADVVQANGTIDHELARTRATPGFAMRQVGNDAIAVATALGDRLAPALASTLQAAEPLLGVVAAMADGFSRLPLPIQSTAIAAAALAVVAGPLLLALSALVPAWGALEVLATGAGLAGAGSLMRIVGAGAVALSVAATGAGYAVNGLSGSATAAGAPLQTMGERIEDVGKRAAEAKGTIDLLNESANRVGTGAPQAPYVPPPTAISMPAYGGAYTPPFVQGGAETPTPTPPAFRPAVPTFATPTPPSAPVTLRQSEIDTRAEGDREQSAQAVAQAAQQAAASAASMSTSTQSMGADTNEVKNIFRDLELQLQGINVSAKFLGPNFDIAAERANAIEAALKKAGDAGLNPASDAAKKYASELAAAQSSTFQFDQQMVAIRAQAGLTGDAFGAWQQQVSALQSKIAEFESQGNSGAAASLRAQLMDLQKVGPPVENELAKIGRQAAAVGPSFDVSARSIDFLRGAIQEIASLPGANGAIITALQQRVSALAGDTSGLASQFDAASIRARVYGDSQLALEGQVSATKTELDQQITLLAQQQKALGATDPSVVKLTADVDALGRQYRDLNEQLANAKGLQAQRAALEDYDKQLVAIGQKAAIFRAFGLQGSDDVTGALQQKISAGRSRLDTLTAPGAEKANPEEEQGRQEEIQTVAIEVKGYEQALKVANLIGDTFTTVADSISSAFSTSVQGIIQGTTTLGQAARAAGQSMLLSLSDAAVKGSAEWAAGQAKNVVVAWAAQAGIIGATEAGSNARTGMAWAEAYQSIAAKDGEALAHGVAETAKTTATAVNSGSRTGLTLGEIATSIGAKIGEVSAWVAGEALKLAASAATIAVSLAGTIQLVAQTIELAAAFAVAAASMIVMAILQPLIAIEAGALASAMHEVAVGAAVAAIALSAESVAMIPYIGGFAAGPTAVITAAMIASGQATVTASGSAAGGAYLQSDMMLQAHAKELVLPRRISETVVGAVDLVRSVKRVNAPMLTMPHYAQLGDRIADSVQRRSHDTGAKAQAGNQFTFAPVIQAMDATGVDRVLQEHGDRFSRFFGDRVRGFDQNMARRLR